MKKQKEIEIRVPSTLYWAVRNRKKIAAYTVAAYVAIIITLTLLA